MKSKKTKFVSVLVLAIAIVLCTFIQSYASYPCPACGRSLVYFSEVRYDGEAVFPGEHATFTSCAFKYQEHTMNWKFNVTGYRCTGCSWRDEAYGPDYGWYCSAN